MWVCVYMDECVSLSVCVSVWVSLCGSEDMSVYVSLGCDCLSVYVYESVCESVRLCLYL